MRVRHVHDRSRATKQLDDDAARTLAGIARVALVRQTEHEDAAPVERLGRAVQPLGEPLDHVLGHVVVHVVGQLDETEGLSERTPHTPGQIARVDGQAMTADARAGLEREKAERLRGGRVDRLPHIDVEGIGIDRQLVHQRDVDVPEGVLEKLRQLGLAGARHGHRRVDDRVEEAPHCVQGRRIDAGDDLRRVDQVPDGVPRIDAFGAVAEVEIDPGTSPDPASSNGATNSSVVPGYVVDSRITMQPGRTWAATTRAASSTCERSGTPSRSGVGTSMIATSNPSSAPSSALTR